MNNKLHNSIFKYNIINIINLKYIIYKTAITIVWL